MSASACQMNILEFECVVNTYDTYRCSEGLRVRGPESSVYDYGFGRLMPVTLKSLSAHSDVCQENAKTARKTSLPREACLVQEF